MAEPFLGAACLRDGSAGRRFRDAAREHTEDQRHRQIFTARERHRHLAERAAPMLIAVSNPSHGSRPAASHENVTLYRVAADTTACRPAFQFKGKLLYGVREAV